MLTLRRMPNVRCHLRLENETQKELEAANQVDLHLYRHLTDCKDSDHLPRALCKFGHATQCI